MNKQKKHICLISTSFPELSDGSEAAGDFVYDFAQALSAHCHVSVVVPGTVSEKIVVNSSFSITRFKVPYLPLSLLKPLNPKYWRAIFLTLYRGLSTIDNLTKQSSPDYFFALWSLPCGFWAKSVGKKYNIPYSTWSLGSDIWSLKKIPIIHTVLKNVLLKSHFNFADGFKLALDVEKISNKKCYFLPSTRSLNIKQSKKLKEEGAYNLAFLGRWHPNKGIDILLQALALLPEQTLHNIKEIKICGGGILEDLVNNKSEQLMAKGVPLCIHGYLNKVNAIDLLYWADYLIIPSRIESIPVVFSDAMKCFCPVVCMPVGDLPRLINKYQTGILATDTTAESLAFAIQEIVQHSPVDYSDGLAKASDDFNMERIAVGLLKKIFSE